jgi:hypothetical protein
MAAGDSPGELGHLESKFCTTVLWPQVTLERQPLHPVIPGPKEALWKSQVATLKSRNTGRRGGCGQRRGPWTVTLRSLTGTPLSRTEGAACPGLYVLQIKCVHCPLPPLPHDPFISRLLSSLGKRDLMLGNGGIGDMFHWESGYLLLTAA